MKCLIWALSAVLMFLAGCHSSSTSFDSRAERLLAAAELRPKELDDAIVEYVKRDLNQESYYFLDSAEQCGNCVRVVLARFSKPTEKWVQESRDIAQAVDYAIYSYELSIFSKNEFGDRVALNLPRRNTNPNIMATYAPYMQIGEYRGFAWSTVELRLLAPQTLVHSELYVERPSLQRVVGTVSNETGKNTHVLPSDVLKTSVVKFSGCE